MVKVEYAKDAPDGKADVLFGELSFDIMGAVFEVHNTLGPGFSESIYEEALALELAERGILFERQKGITVVYKGGSVGDYRLDFLIDGKVVIELKAVSEVSDLFAAQVLSYLKATGMRLGILINFGKKRVESMRIVL